MLFLEHLTTSRSNSDVWLMSLSLKLHHYVISKWFLSIDHHDFTVNNIYNTAELSSPLCNLMKCVCVSVPPLSERC